MKQISLLMMLICSIMGRGQTWLSVARDTAHVDTAFSKAFTKLISIAGSDFSTLPKKMVRYTYIDTIWDVNALLPGAYQAKLNKSNGATILTEGFRYKDETGLENLLHNVMASLPDDYVYSLDYDSTTYTYDYTFMIDPESKKKHLGYANYIHLTGDVESVFLFLGHAPAWLNKPHW